MQESVSLSTHAKLERFLSADIPDPQLCRRRTISIEGSSAFRTAAFSLHCMGSGVRPLEFARSWIVPFGPCGVACSMQCLEERFVDVL